MAAYATQQDLEDRYGSAEVLLVSDRDGDGSIDAGVVSEALQDATDEIDSYLSARYDLPLATTPGILTRRCGDIAMYLMADTADSLTEERTNRYKAAISWLKDLVKGNASLGLDQEPATTPQAVAVASINSDRVFTRSSMRGL